MKRIFFIIIVVFVLVAAFFFLKNEANAPQIEQSNISKNMKITSSAFLAGKMIPEKYTCQGENVNPPLNIEGVPENANSLVLIVDDPDAPVGTWTHWTLWDIPLSVSSIDENSVPEGGVEGVTSFGEAGYGGPCPPSGTHRYFFKLYALDSLLEVGPETPVDDLVKEMDGHVLDRAELIGLYEKK